MGHSEEDWNSLTREKQEAWLDEQTRDWAIGYIDYSWQIVQEED